jgi:hypothetical protein
MDVDNILLREPVTIEDVMREVKALREEVKAMRNYPIVMRSHPLDALGSVGGKISFGNAG